MNQPVEVSNHQFKVSPAVIRKLIFQQAGSLPKAVAELVMNEIDARASEVIITTGNPNKLGFINSVTVEGNGCGFTSHEEILKLFGKLGFNHSTDEEMAKNRRYGRFGIGRAAILTFGKCKWITNEFEICVDLDSNSKDAPPYTITEHETKLYNGCKVEVTLNKAVDFYDLRSMVGEITSMVKFSPKNIIINEEKVNDGISDEWSILSDSIAFLWDEGSQTGLDIYNDGIFVCSYPHSKFGVSGRLTSVEDTFDVNMARNDILQSSCPLWKSLKKLLKPFSDITAKKKLTLSVDDRIFMLRNFLAKETSYETIEKANLIKAVNGRFYSIASALKYAEARFSLAPSKDSNVGENIHSGKEAFVISPEWLHDLGYDSLDDLFECISLAVEEAQNNTRWGSAHTLYSYYFEKKGYRIIEFDLLAKSHSSTSSIIKETSLDDLSSIKLKTMQYLADAIHNQKFAAYLLHQRDNPVLKRALRFGDSECSLAWTNSKTYIALNKSYVDEMFTQGLEGFFNLASIILHEYCHDSDSEGDHAHSETFYRNFNIHLSSDSQFLICEKAVIFYYKLLIKNGLTIPQSLHNKFVRKTPKNLAAHLNQI